MMANKASIRFVKNLVAAFSRWKITQETVDLYIDHLSGWNLSDDQWQRASSRIIADRPDSELPTLSVIYSYLREQQAPLEGPSDLGWMAWRRHGKCHSMRIKNIGGSWYWALMTVKDRAGREVVLQVHPGEPAIPPNGATDIVVTPDCPVRERPCTQEEGRRAFLEGFIRAGGSLAKLDEYFGTLLKREPEPQCKEG